MSKWLLFFSYALCFNNLLAQEGVVNTAVMDTLTATTIGHLGIGGYVDSYYSYSFNQPAKNRDPFFVSNDQLNEITINLAYLDLRYKSTNFRARLVPGFGTYMNANYINESGSLKNFVEGNVGVRLFAKRDIWLDVGVFGSPYTNESAISKDHLMYTRSFAPQNVPYYLSGAKLTIPLSDKVTTTLYLLNGWQVIQDNHNGKSLGTQVELRPNPKMLFNWDTYIGDERSTLHPDFRMRYFTDLYWIYKASKKFDATSCVYIGSQDRINISQATWGTINFIGRYYFKDALSLSGRIEYFKDADGVFQLTQLGTLGFETYSSGLCLNYSPNHNALFRLEAREFFSPKTVYLDKDQHPTSTNTQITASLTAWF